MEKSKSKREEKVKKREVREELSDQNRKEYLAEVLRDILCLDVFY